MFKMRCEAGYGGWFFRVYHRQGKCFLKLWKPENESNENMKFHLHLDRIEALQKIQRETTNAGAERTRRVLELAQSWNERHRVV